MAADAEKYDGALLSILQNEGKVAPFIDIMLGFLYRRTDFFRIMSSETDNLGFPPGVAFKLLENIFKKYEALAKKDSLKMAEMREAREGRKKEIDSSAKHTPKDAADTNSETSKAVSKTPVDPQNVVDSEADTQAQAEGKPPVREEKMETESSESGATGEEEEKEDPEAAKLRRELQSNPLTYNGAERDTYFWSQSITETDVRVKVPKHIVKGRQLKVDIKNKHIKASCQESDGSWRTLVDGALTWDINKDESLWTLSPGEFVHINLEKKQERWWENVFTDEPKINTRKIDCSRPMTDLDDEAQSKIEEMMFNQRQKQLGLPESHEQKTHDMLRKAWDAEGSPFKGQPFDPSKFKVDPNGVVNIQDS